MAKSNILIVDDNPANLKLLEEMLSAEGHQVRSFPLGRLALAAAKLRPPDLILLDINMPEMNGYEVCEIAKSSAELSNIPIIFLSALSETRDKVKAFRSGAVDYISKPFQFEEVHARVETHLKLHHLQQDLKIQNERLEEAVAARTLELAEANGRLTILDRSKSDFLSLISHEFRTPLHGLLGVGEIILEEMPANVASDELREAFLESRRRILSILDDALLLTQIDVNGARFRSASVSLNSVLSRAIENASDFASIRRVVLPPAPAVAESVRPDYVLGNEDLLVKALSGLFETAVKFSGEGEAIRLSREVKPESVTIIIESHGPTIPSEALPKFFDLFSIGGAITPGGDLGLSAPVAHRILSLFGASVAVENRDDPSGIRLIALLMATARTGLARPLRSD